MYIYITLYSDMFSSIGWHLWPANTVTRIKKAEILNTSHKWCWQKQNNYNYIYLYSCMQMYTYRTFYVSAMCNLALYRRYLCWLKAKRWTTQFLHIGWKFIEDKWNTQLHILGEVVSALRCIHACRCGSAVCH